MKVETKYLALYMILATLLSTLLIDHSIVDDKELENNYILKFLASISYEVYLVQYPVIFFMQYCTLNVYIHIILVFSITMIISIMIHWLLNISNSERVFRIVKCIIICIIILAGGIVLVISKDNTSEMEELDQLLSYNLKKNEIRVNNDDYLNENETIEIEEEVRNTYVVGVGDSVLLAAIDELYDTFPNGYFDGKVSRQIAEAEEILRELIEEDRLGNIVILALANNGEFSKKKNDELFDLLENRQVYWVDAVGADDPEYNIKFEEYAKDHSNIHIVKWKEASKDHPEYFWADKIHPKNEGARVYAQIIYETICNEYTNN